MQEMLEETKSGRVAIAMRRITERASMRIARFAFSQVMPPPFSPQKATDTGQHLEIRTLWPFVTTIHIRCGGEHPPNFMV